MAVVFLRTMYPYRGDPGQPGPRTRTWTSGYWKPFEQLLRDCLADLGHTVVEQTAHSSVPDDSSGADLRIVAHRTRRDGPGDLFYKQMHLPTLFTIDRWGWGADDSRMQRPPNLDGIDQAAADDLVRRLYRRYVEAGQSKLAQPTRGDGEGWPEGYVFLPTQMPRDYVQVHHSPIPMTELVVRTARWAEARGQNLVVKLHPGLDGSAFPEIGETVRALVRECPHVTCSGANVHDLIASSLGVFTMNSGVGFEALIHGRPVVTFGGCDYQWATFRGRVECLDEARSFLLGYDEAQAREAARFLCFYCRVHALSVEDEDLPDTRRRLTDYLVQALEGR